jgi:hypothetical protein
MVVDVAVNTRGHGLRPREWPRNNSLTSFRQHPLTVVNFIFSGCRHLLSSNFSSLLFGMFCYFSLSLSSVLVGEDCRPRCHTPYQSHRTIFSTSIRAFEQPRSMSLSRPHIKLRPHTSLPGCVFAMTYSMYSGKNPLNCQSIMLDMT